MVQYSQCLWYSTSQDQQPVLLGTDIPVLLATDTTVLLGADSTELHGTDSTVLLGTNGTALLGANGTVLPTAAQCLAATLLLSRALWQLKYMEPGFSLYVWDDPYNGPSDGPRQLGDYSYFIVRLPSMRPCS